jgi:hypothetical protein
LTRLTEMANHFRVVYDDKPISWYMARGEHRSDAVQRTIERQAEWLGEGERFLRDTGETGTSELDVEGERWWFKFLLEVPD